MRQVALVLLLLAAALSGCLGADPAPAPATMNGADEADTTPGTIDLTVLDPGQVPVPDVPVSLSAPHGTFTETTNVLGIARFTEVPPGNVTLSASAAGFLVANLTFTLQPGQNAAPSLTLQHAGPRAHVAEFPFEGFFDCTATYIIITGDCFTLVQFVGDALGQPLPEVTSHDALFDFDVGPGWTLIRVTQEWQDADQSIGSMMRVNVGPHGPGNVNEYERYGLAEGESPIVLELVAGELHSHASHEDMLIPLEGAELQAWSFHMGLNATHNPGGTNFLGAGFAYQQRFSVLIEVHYET